MTANKRFLKEIQRLYLQQSQKELLKNDDISDEDKSRIFMEMCRSYDKIVNGSSELININHMLNIINKQ